METESGSDLLERAVRFAEGRAKDRVAELRRKHAGATRQVLAEKLVRSFSRRAGAGGAATGALAMVSLGAGLPAGLALTLALEAELLLSLMELYGLERAGAEGRLKLYALWAGSGVADALKNAGLRAGAETVGRVLAESLPAQLIAKLNPLLVRAVLKRLGLGWIPRMMKLWPLLGAPIGYVVDASAMRALGSATIATLEGLAVREPIAQPIA